MNRTKTETEDWKAVILQLKDIADQKGVSQVDVATRTGMTQPNISRLFALKYVPKLSTVVLIAQALEVELTVRDNIPEDPLQSFEQQKAKDHLDILQMKLNRGEITLEEFLIEYKK